MNNKIHILQPKDEPTPNPHTELAEALALLEAEEISALAYVYWEERAFRDGSPEEDWLRAIDELIRRKTGGGIDLVS